MLPEAWRRPRGPAATSQPNARRLADAIRDRLHERRRFATRRHWLLNVYNRLLLRWPHARLPFRGRIVTVRLAGGEAPFFVRLGTWDLRVVEEVQVERVYAPLFDAVRDPPRRILDVGANIGVTVRLWRSRWPQAEIVAVEPDAENLDLCRRNASAVGSHGVEFIGACVGGRARPVTLDRSSGHHPIFEMREHDGSSEPALQAMTVAEILGRAGWRDRVDLLKCDVEGAEREVFAACADWIDAVGAIVVEVHPPYTPEDLFRDASVGRTRARLHSYDAATRIAMIWPASPLETPGED